MRHVTISTLTKILVIFIASVFVSLLCTPLRAFLSGEYFTSTYISAPVGFILYYILTYKLCTRYANSIHPITILLVIICGFISLQLPVRITDFKGSAITLPEQFIYLIGIILGYLSNRDYIKTWKAIIIGGLTYLIVLPICFPLYVHFLDYGTITGNISKKTIIPNFRIIDEKGDTLSLYDLKNNYIIFDIWHSACGSCFKAFPKVQNFYQQMRYENNIEVYALNYPIDRTNPFLLMKEKGYNIPVLQILEEEKIVIKKDIDLEVFPTVIIINKNHQLVFRGDINGAKKYIKQISEK